jgi:transposase
VGFARRVGGGLTSSSLVASIDTTGIAVRTLQAQIRTVLSVVHRPTASPAAAAFCTLLRPRPWRYDTFKLSTDPDFEAKLVDIVGLYLDPPERAAVFCFDENTQVQALDRTQPSLPLRPGRAGTMTHDYKRNGTTDLFAALNVATGEVIHDTRRSHAATDVLAFFKFLDAHVPRGLEIHVVLDNLSAHKAEAV